jgi:hypothetical protein
MVRNRFNNRDEFPQVAGIECINRLASDFLKFRYKSVRMKLRYTRSNPRLKQLTTREVDELINVTILKPLTQPKIERKEKKVFNSWQLPEGPTGFRKARKHDPL